MQIHMEGFNNAPLLIRVSKIRECMGLSSLPKSVLLNELDPLLLSLLQDEKNYIGEFDIHPILQEEQRLLLFDKKWSLWDDWNRWDKNGH